MDNYSNYKDYDNYPEEWEDTEEKCPQCKKSLLIRTPVADGPDDFHWLYKCEKCDFEEG